MKTTSMIMGLCLSLFALGCADDGLGSGRGESCRARNDCAGGLHCINNVCTLNDFDVEPSATSCDLIECSVDADCCGELSSFCLSLQEDCSLGDTFACDDFDRNCRCREGCRENRCIPTCATDADCFGGSCMAGTCVNCVTDTDCFEGAVCRSGACVEACASNADCPYFHSCEAGECVETGCITDRECIAFTDNPRAVCVDGECSAPCESDAQCNLGGYQFQSCEGGQCRYIGCQTDEECRIFLDVRPGDGTYAICR